MKKQILVIGLVLTAGILHAQIQVNNGTNSGIANSNVLLDGSTYFSTESGAQPNTGKGIVVPSVNLVNFEFDLTLADSVTFPTYFDGMIVYNNATGNTLTSGNRPSMATAVVPGFYYFSNPNGASNGNVTGGQWKAIGSNGANIYNADGTLNGNRTVAQGANTLAFTGTANNAFSVNGSTFSVDAGSNSVGLGTTTPTSRLSIVGTGKSNDNIDIKSYTNGTINEGVISMYKAQGTSASPVAVFNSDVLGSYSFFGYDGSTFQRTAAFGAAVNGSVTTGSVPTDLYFSAGNGNGNAQERMRITSAGKVGIGTSSPADMLDINGNTIIRGTATIKTTSPTTVINQNVLSLESDGKVSTRFINYITNQGIGLNNTVPAPAGSLITGSFVNNICNDGTIFKKFTVQLILNYDGTFSKLYTQGPALVDVTGDGTSTIRFSYTEHCSARVSFLQFSYSGGNTTITSDNLGNNPVASYTIR